MHAHLNAGKGTIVSSEDLYKQMVTLMNTGAGADPEAKRLKWGESMREEPVSEPGGRESDRKRRRDRQRETKEGQK